MLTVYTAIELKQDEILCVSIHPGWVKTDMGGDKVSLISSLKNIYIHFVFCCNITYACMHTYILQQKTKTLLLFFLYNSTLNICN